MSSTVLCPLLSKQLFEGVMIIIHILEIRKLRHREKLLAQDYMAGGGQG